MRFPRNAKIFRGQLDLMPFASVLFLLVIFVVLGSLLYTPGIPFQLSSDTREQARSNKIITITSKGDILFNGTTNRLEEIEPLLEEFKKLPPQSILVFKREEGAAKDIPARIRERAKDLPLTFETAEALVDLPLATGLSGITDPTVVVAVSFGGQFFYQNRLVTEKELSQELKAAVRKSKEPLTLLVMADKSALYEVMMKLSVIAQEAGIKKMFQVARPKS